MKEMPQRRVNFQQGGLKQATRMPEVTVIKHFHPNPNRDPMGPFPEIKCLDASPESIKCMHQHPVYKFVENFLSNNNPGSKTCSHVKSKCSPRIINKYNINPQYVATIARNFTTKKSAVPPHVCTPRQERIKTNLNNINSRSNIRVSIAAPNCFREKDAPSSPRLKFSNTMNTCADHYIEELKNEIKQSKSKIRHAITETDEDAYVANLKDELMVQKSRCLDDARSIINDLQKEIHSYRIQVKAKCNSSSDTVSGDKTPTWGSRLSSPKKQCDNFIYDPNHTPDGAAGCQTLWRSKASFASSTEMDYGQATEINFEEKLQEANALIEKVRSALRDIGKGMYKESKRKIPVEKQQIRDCGDEPLCVERKCGSCSPKKKSVEAIRKIDQKKDVCSEYMVKKLIQEVKKKSEEQKKMLQEEMKRSPTGDGKKHETRKVAERKSSPQETRAAKTKKDELSSSEKDTHLSKSMEILQRKLKTIAEMSESDMTPDSKKKNLPVVLMERGSSPINVQCAPRKKSDAFSETGTSISDMQDFYRKVSERLITEQSKVNSLSAENTQRTSSTKNTTTAVKENASERFRKNDRTSKLSIQLMPPVHIPGGLVMQRTLNLCIKPTGSSTNYHPSCSNIAYKEIRADRKDERDSHVGSKELDILKPTPSSSSKRRTSGLTEDAVRLFRSFQILEEDPRSSQMSLTNITGMRSRSIAGTVRSHDIVKPGTYLKSPLELGFYQTKSVQCSSTSLNNEHTNPSIELPTIERPIPTMETPISVTSRNEEEHEIVSVQESYIQPKKIEKSVIDYPSLFSDDSVRKQPEQTFMEPPVRDVNVAEILNILSGNKEKDMVSIGPSLDDYDKQRRSITLLLDSQVDKDETAKKLESSSSSSDVTLEEKERKKNGKKVVQKDLNSSSSSTSGSSNTHTREETKRPYESFEVSRESSGTTVEEQSISKNDPETNVETDVSKKPKVKESKKVDINIQVSLSSETLSSASEVAVPGFITGLTETSEEHLYRLRSNPSFGKTDRTSWSTTKIQTLRDVVSSKDEMLKKQQLLREGALSKEEMRRRSRFEEARERIVSSLEYSDGYRESEDEKTPEAPSTMSTLSEKTKMERLRQFQKMAQDAFRLEKEPEKDVRMSLIVQKPNGGEDGDRSSSFTKAPFYRRVFEKILDPSRKMMQKSHSDPSPVDESISEGEIKCRSSASIGEIRPVARYALDRKKINKGVLRYMKKRQDDFGDKSWRIARQRTQYNAWVSLYLQNHQNMSLINDSTSTSVSGKK